MRILPRDVAADPLGGVNVAIYDTAQAVLHTQQRPERFPEDFRARASALLLRSQNADGSWGSTHWPSRYRLVPTLAATAALAADDAGRAAFCHGLRYVVRHRGELAPDAQPDLTAVAFIVPALLEQLERSIARGMWQGKELYEPHRIVHATVAAAKVPMTSAGPEQPL